MAGIHQGLPASTPKSGIFRMALALYHGLNVKDARELAHPMPRKEQNLATANNGKTDFSCKVPEELGKLPDDVNHSYAIRVGMAMCLGYSREDAERYAQLPHGGGWQKGKSRKAA